jgi:DNA-binding GntR family transcriptional regulator
MDPTTPQAIAQSLQDDARCGRLRAGAILHQEELARRFAVSRQPIRLALEILRASGLVVARRDRSLAIADFSAAAIRDLQAVRTLVEREALGLAIPRLSDRDTLEAAHIQELLEIETDPKTLVELDCAFHAALYKACGNDRLLKLIDDLRREDLRPYREQPMGSPNRRTWSQQHRSLLRKCRAGDSVGALAVLGKHFSTSENR